ncbi:MAG: N-acetylmuramoyl-L-alanine amidase [Fimbriimonadaceae bacterium]
MILSVLIGLLDFNEFERKPLSGYKITIDPGHTSENGKGTKGRTLTELEVCWDMSLRTAKYLRQNGALVKLTKSSVGEVVTNQKRAEIGNDFGSDLVIRLHCDAADERGFATYYPNIAGMVRGVKGPAKDVIASSKRFAKVFHESLAKGLAGELNNRGLKTEQSTMIGAKQGALTGSIFSKRPVLLVEMVVLSQREDEDWMGKDGNRDLYAKALSSAVKAVFKKYPR